MACFGPEEPAEDEPGRFGLGLTLVGVLLLTTFLAFYFLALGFTDPKTFLNNWVVIAVLLAVALAAGGLNRKFRPAQPKPGVASVLTAFGAAATGVFADSKILEAWKNPPFDPTIGALLLSAVLACVPALLGWKNERSLERSKRILQIKKTGLEATNRNLVSTGKWQAIHLTVLARQNQILLEQNKLLEDEARRLRAAIEDERKGAARLP